MMYSEFIAMANVDSVSEADYAIIEKVYNYHPSIKSKADIAHIYGDLGMTVIRDMLPRAEKVEAIEVELHGAKEHVKHLEVLYREACE